MFSAGPTDFLVSKPKQMKRRYAWFAGRLAAPRMPVSDALLPADVRQRNMERFCAECAQHEFCTKALTFCAQVLPKEPDWQDFLSNRLADVDGGEETPARNEVAQWLRSYGVRVVRWTTIRLCDSKEISFPPFLHTCDLSSAKKGECCRMVLEWIPTTEIDVREPA